MVISRVVSSLIINFSPWLVCLPGAVRSVCVSAVSSVGSTHYTRCNSLFLWDWDAETVWNGIPTLCNSLFVLGALHHCPWCWRLLDSGGWPGASAHPEPPLLGHGRCSFRVWERIYSTILLGTVVCHYLSFTFSISMNWLAFFFSFFFSFFFTDVHLCPVLSLAIHYLMLQNKQMKIRKTNVITNVLTATVCDNLPHFSWEGTFCKEKKKKVFNSWNVFLAGIPL